MRSLIYFLTLSPLYAIVLVLASVFALPTFADIRLPKIFGDNMVLQRNSPLPHLGLG